MTTLCQTPLRLTPRQARVYRAVVMATNGGAATFVGQLHIEGVNQVEIGDVLFVLKRKGAIQFHRVGVGRSIRLNGPRRPVEERTDLRGYCKGGPDGLTDRQRAARDLAVVLTDGGAKEFEGPLPSLPGMAASSLATAFYALANKGWIAKRAAPGRRGHVAIRLLRGADGASVDGIRDVAAGPSEAATRESSETGVLRADSRQPSDCRASTTDSGRRSAPGAADSVGCRWIDGTVGEPGWAWCCRPLVSVAVGPERAWCAEHRKRVYVRAEAQPGVRKRPLHSRLELQRMEAAP